MTKARLLGSASARAAAMGLTIWAGGAVLSPALAQQTPANTSAAANQDGGNQVEEVVVTGSLIRGTPEDAALPVDVIGQEELEKQGSPTTVELIKSLTVSNGVLGDTNQFDARAQGSEGSGSVNLRGLGSQRTLVLLNGRRLAINPVAGAGAGVVDTNMMPAAAIGRVEVLKDGAAATYGSDAIAGVVNFITRTNYEGLELAADYKFIDGSSGDYGGSILFGMPVTDDGNLLLSVGYQHRSKLRVTDRDFANRPFLENPQGGWTGGSSPGLFATLGGTTFRDPACAVLGGFPSILGAQTCQTHFVEFDNLIEKEEHLQAFGSFDYDITQNHRFHIEGLYGKTEVPEADTSASYLLTVGPSRQALPAAIGAALIPGAAYTANFYYVPASNPGLIAFRQQFPTVPSGAGDVLVPLLANRPLLAGGNPLFNELTGDRGSSFFKRFYEAYRVTGGFTGDLGFRDFAYDINANYSVEEHQRTEYDTLANRFQLALRGLGGPSCNIAANTPGQNGCFYFNPFSTAIATSVLEGGGPNPNFVASTANRNDVIAQFFQRRTASFESKLFTAEAAISGGLGFTLGGGDAKFALGTQYRKDNFNSNYGPLNNVATAPCIGSVDFNDNSCVNQTGAFVFLGPAATRRLSTDIYAFFGEVQLPFSDTFNVQIAARFEDYGGQVGDTFNPKISARWQATEWLALRGSAGTTFRGPPTAYLDDNKVTSLQVIGGAFKPVDVQGNPGLSPEKADTYNAGILIDAGGLRASLDYFRFDFRDAIIGEGVAGIISALYPTATTNNCATVPSAFLARFTFSAPCAGGVGNVARLLTRFVNSAKIKNDGVDLNIDYDFGDIYGGEFSVGGSATYILNYEVGTQFVEGVAVAPKFNGVGKLNFQTTIVPLPRYKFNTFAEYDRNGHNFRATLNYINGYTDGNRDAIFGPNPAAGGIAITRGRRIHNFVTLDLSYRVLLPQRTTFIVSAENVTDTDPPFARLDLSYDPFTANPYGRMVKVAVKKSF